MELQRLVSKTIMRLGKNGKEKLALSADLSVSTIVNILNNSHIPLPQTAYALAKACECDDDEALKISEECASLRAKETA